MPIRIRQGELEDSQPVFTVFMKSIMELGQRLGSMPISGGQNPEVMENLWQRRRGLFEHLAQANEEFWVAERDGRVIGYARSICRDRVRQLTEFFILPEEQSSGLGRQLLERAFPIDGADRRIVLASPDTKALSLYLKFGLFPNFPSYFFSRAAEEQPLETDLIFLPLSSGELGHLGELDEAILGYRRVEDHSWLVHDRQGWLYLRDGATVGYGYTDPAGFNHGPFALRQASDFEAVLAHAENQAALTGSALGVEVPLVNRHAVRYLLRRGYRMDSFFEYFMSDQPFGSFENYIFTSPPFIT